MRAANGLEAIEVASAHSIDLVLLDPNMPGQGGWDTFERITSEHSNLAVLIITAKPDQLFASLAAGIGALLEKPLDFHLLLKDRERLAERIRRTAPNALGRTRHDPPLPPIHRQGS